MTAEANERGLFIIESSSRLDGSTSLPTMLLAFAALVTYMATRHKAFRFMRLPTNLNIV